MHSAQPEPVIAIPTFEWGSAERVAAATLVLLGLGLVIFNLIRIIIHPIGDFHYHWQLGYDLVHGRSLYLGPGGGPPEYPNPYPPFWAMAHAPLTIVSAHIAQIIVFLPLYLGSLSLLLWVLHSLGKQYLPLDQAGEFWTTAISMLFALQFLARDMAECGVNVGLVALAWLAIYAWAHGRDCVGGISLGLAIALKMTAALFIPYFLWKGQWKIAGAALLFAVIFTVLPVFVRGPTMFATDLRQWAVIVRGIGSDETSKQVLGQESTRNFALRPALKRLLGSAENPSSGNAEGLAVSASKIARFVTYAVELSLLALFAWAARARVRKRSDLVILYECAGVSLLMLLLSPITWGHHCVGTLPAFYLLFRTVFSSRCFPRWMLVPFTCIVLALASNRVLIGRELSSLLSRYSVITWEVIALLILTLGCRNFALRQSVLATDRPLQSH